MTIDYDLWFPTVIGKIDCPFFNEVQSEYKKHLNLSEYTYQGYVYHEIHNDIRFERLNNWIIARVNEFSLKHNVPEKMIPKQSWYNDYHPNGNIPWHKHPGWIWTATFFLESDINDSCLEFRSPSYGDNINGMLKRSPHEHEQVSYNQFTYETCEYQPVPGRLIIFRSSIEHMAFNKNPNLTSRVVLTYNFDKE
jgi:hypothetical protein